MGTVDDHADMLRPARQQDQDALFHIEPSWRDHWWGLPEFVANDIRPVRQLTLQFMTEQDFIDYQQSAGLRVDVGHPVAWWPPRAPEARLAYKWEGDPSPTRYPVYIPSKGRVDVATTPRLLDQAGVDYRLVVESTEYDAYCARYGADKVLCLPFHDLGQGSIPARNWIWQHAVDNGHPWHWIIDDNVNRLVRLHGNRRLGVYRSSAPFRMVEDFADRYDNLAFAGLQSAAFGRETRRSPITLNTRVYSVTLIRTDLPYRWRGRYNEDTDLCLRALKDGWSTALFMSFLQQKTSTARGDGTGGIRGGNTDHVYNTGDHRRAFAESLREQHPDVVEVTWKWGRWHHHVDYSPFKGNDPKLRANVTPTKHFDDYGLRLVRASDAQSELDNDVEEW